MKILKNILSYCKKCEVVNIKLCNKKANIK